MIYLTLCDIVIIFLTLPTLDMKDGGEFRSEDTADDVVWSALMSV